MVSAVQREGKVMGVDGVGTEGTDGCPLLSFGQAAEGPAAEACGWVESKVVAVGRGIGGGQV